MQMPLLEQDDSTHGSAFLLVFSFLIEFRLQPSLSRHTIDLTRLISQYLPVNLGGQQHFLFQQLPPLRHGMVRLDTGHSGSIL